MTTAARKRNCLFVAVFSAAVLIAAPFVGMHSITPSDLLQPGYARDIFWQLRLPRTALGFLAGAGLGLGGMVFQALFQNSLATPFTLGVASGASFGAVLGIRFGLTGSVLGVNLLNICGLSGALLATAMVYGFTRTKRYSSSATMLLAGVAMSFLFSSLILFQQYLSDFTQSFRVVRWLMGGLEVVGFVSVIQLLPFVMIGSTLVFLLAKEIDLMAMGEELAQTRGVAVGRVRLGLFLGVSLMVGAVVSLTGPIGFVGMMIPHVCRRLLGARHHLLAPMVFIFSGAFLVLCDAFARVIIAPAELPVGVVSALLGGPFFLWILFWDDEGASGRL